MRQMINVGKQIRYNRIVNPDTGRTLIVPLDHGIIMGPVHGVENPALTVRKVIAGGVNALAFNAGMAANIYAEYMNRCGTIFNLMNMITDETDHALIGTVEYALRNGADAIAVQLLVGSPHEKEMLQSIRVVVDECSKWGFPLLGMLYWAGDEVEGKTQTDLYCHVARAGAELGLDIVKTNYTGDPETFRKLVASCPAPVVIAGGPKRDSFRETLQDVKDAVDCGAIGVALGRNIWQNPNPTAATAALVDVIHHGKSLDEIAIPEA